MEERIKRLDISKVKQLALPDLAVEETGEGWVSPEEAERRSLQAQAALDLAFKDSEKENPELTHWMAEYQYLVDAGWKWRIAAFIAWSCVPRKLRWPKTQDELATQVLGLTSARQISTWRERHPQIDEMIGLLQTAPLEAHRLSVIKALVESASNANYKNHQDRKLFLEMTGDYTPKQKVEIERGDPDDLSGLSDAELEEMKRRAEERNG